MKRICCSTFHIGNPQFGEKPPMSDSSETHGFCPTCFPKEMESIRRQKIEAIKETESIFFTHKSNKEKGD